MDSPLFPFASCAFQAPCWAPNRRLLHSGPRPYSHPPTARSQVPLHLLPTHTQMSGPAPVMPGKARAQPGQCKAERTRGASLQSQRREPPLGWAFGAPRRQGCFSQFPELMLTSGPLHLNLFCQEGSSPSPQIIAALFIHFLFPVHTDTPSNSPYLHL